MQLSGTRYNLQPSLDQQLTPPVAQVGQKPFSWGGLALAALGSLTMLALGISVDQLIRELFQRHEWLGWVGMAATSLLVFAALAITLKEFWGMARLRKIENIRHDGAMAIEQDDVNAAKLVVSRISALYARRPETANGRSKLAAHLGEIIDASDLVGLIERDLLAPLDLQARKMVLQSGKKSFRGYGGQSTRHC